MIEYCDSSQIIKCVKNKHLFVKNVEDTSIAKEQRLIQQLNSFNS